MKVYLFSDYLKTIHGGQPDEYQLIGEIEPITKFPDGIVEIQGKLARVCTLTSDDSVYIEYIKSIPKEDEVSFSNNITCPYCGSEDHDSWEAADSDDGSQCDTCGSVFSYEREVEVTYSSKIVERNDKVMKLSIKGDI